MSNQVASAGQPKPGHVQMEEVSNDTPSNQPHLFIDKLSITFDIQAEGHRKYIAGQLIDLPKEPGSGWLAAQRGRYKYAARLHQMHCKSHGAQSPWMKDYVLFQAQPVNGEGGYLRMEWNPAKLGAPAKDSMFKTLNDLFDLPPPRVDEAKVTRVDIAIDLPNVRIGDYSFERIKSPIRTHVSRHGTLETIYLGKQASGQFRIYDKRAQLGVGTTDLTRIEVCSRPNKPAALLHTLHNPFKSLRVTDLTKTDLGVGEPHMRSLRRALRAEGIAGPLSDFPPLAAKQHKATILAAGPAFWAPHNLWKGWPAAIAAAFPTFGKPDHYGTMDTYPQFMQSIAQMSAL